MLSRRNIRIKVMQVLYMMSRDQSLSYPNAMNRYRDSVRRAYQLYQFNLLFLVKIAGHARIVAAKKAAKHLPTEADLAFRPKIADNPLIQSIVRNEHFGRLVKKNAVEARIKQDDVRQYYLEFSKTDAYQAYLKGGDSHQEHKQILLDLFKYLVGNENYNDLMEENFAVWLDDKSLVVGAVKKTLKALPASEFFVQEYEPQHEAAVDFGENLLEKVVHENAALLKIIEPTLNNWDAERVAIIDMITLKMAVSELTSFPTIPTKVTLNEFVEISKLYSTDKSKDFINGVLDRLMKDMGKDGRIKKEGRGLVD